MANSRREYFRKTRKSRLRELKHSRTGWCGMVSAIAAAVLFVVSVALSFTAAGEAAFPAGTVSLMLAAGAFILGIMAVREPKIRPLPPRTALILGGILTVVLAALYISGMV